MGCTTDTNQDNREPWRNSTQRLCQQHQQREESKNQHRFHTGCIWVHSTSVNKDRRQFTSVNRQHRDGIQGKYQSHAQRIGCLDAELCIQIRRSPEKEEPPNSVCHEFTDNKSPSLFERKTLQETDLLFVFFFDKDNVFFILILFDICQLGFIHMFALVRSRVHEHP